MKYVFYENGISLKDTICQINGVELSSLDVSDFKVDDLKILNDFKDHLLSLKDKRFFIVGDYDCDGICATAIMKRLFDDLKIASNYYIPSRAKEGYGLNMRIVDTAADHGFDVLLCVDNGIIANEQLRHARERGLHTLVIDHHEYRDDPDCDAFLHPNLFDEKYADMCAAGLCALLSSSIREDDLTLVYGGLATLADMVQVLGYNRYLLNTMLSSLKSKDIYPISYLMKSKDYDYETLSFEVIPKINAVSRMDDSLNVNYVVRYLLSERRDCAMYLPKIEEINARLGFLCDVGLDYLTLSRAAATLSGGEAQRIRLATQIGSGLVGVLYILDEPSIGLHQRDNARLLATLKNLRDFVNLAAVKNQVIFLDHRIPPNNQKPRATSVHRRCLARKPPGLREPRVLAYKPDTPQSSWRGKTPQCQV